MNIISITKKELLNFIYSEEFVNLKSLPISRHRALSHYHNPRAKDDDVVLLLCYIENQYCGYLGIFPDNIYSGDKVLPAAWLSCIWVDPEMRGRKIAQTMVEKAIEIWNQNILLVNFTAQAKRTYDRTGLFDDLAKPNGIKAYYKFSLHKILPSKNPKYSKYSGLLKFVDTIGNAMLSIKRPFQKIHYLKNLPQVETIKRIDPETSAFIEKHTTKNLFQRKKEELNWFLTYPWLLSTPIKDEMADKYIFSSVAQSYKVYPLKIKKNQNLVAFIILTYRDGEMKIPYAYFNPNDKDMVLKVIFAYSIRLNIDNFICFQPNLYASFSSVKNPFFHLKKQQRHYIMSKVLLNALSSLDYTIQDGDGDATFT
ncbi:MAG: hypothetical protein C0594_06775 [Marinilabiliales bacterium]|nr:MAG: hypothetical protein C0594_06775 [Marinilabiliales bacterium]